MPNITDELSIEANSVDPEQTAPIGKKDALIIYGGKEISRLEKSLPDPTVEDAESLNEYEKT